MRWTRVAGLCLLAVVGFTAVGVAVDGYSMSGSSAIETPTRTVTYEGQNYTIDSVSRITAGESVTITTSVPSGAAYSITLRGPDNQLISSERKTGDATHTLSYFGPDDEAGTYVATIEEDGETVAVHPIVIAGYDISVSPPDDATAGETATIRATVTERSGEKHASLDRVEVVVGNDDVEVQQPMTRVDDDTYETAVSTDGLATETYNVYVVVRGNETVRERAEILGVSDTVELTVTEASTPTAEETSEAASGGGGPSGGTTTTDEATPTETSTPTVTETSTPTETDTGTETSTPTPTVTETSTPIVTETSTPTETDTVTSVPTATGETAAATATTTAPGGPGNVLTPAPQTGPSTTGGSGPGFTVGLALLAVLAAVALTGRR